MELELLPTPILHDVEQRSDEWFALRMGKLTGSNFPMLMPSSRQKVKVNDTQKKYLFEKACEILTGERKDSFSNAAMQWGTDHEEEAVEYYELEKMTVVNEVGFYEINKNVGDSPDGVTEDRAIEIKCPNSTTHLLYLLDGNELVKKYYWQCYAHMLATGLDKCDLISYDPRFSDDKKMIIITIEKEQSEMDLLQNRLSELVELLESYLNA